MVRVTVELIPFGREEGKRTLGVLEIANTGEGDEHVGHYRYTLRGRLDKKMSAGRIEGWPRLRRHVWDLVTRVLRDDGRG